MAFETDNPAEELRAKAREIFPWDEKLARDTYHWNAADEIDRLNAELDIMRAKLQMAESLLALGGIDVDAHGAVVELAKETMGKLIAAERKIAELRLNQT